MFKSTIGPRSERQKRDDEQFMAALRNIPSLQANHGCISMDAKDLQAQVEELHEVGCRLLAQQPRSKKRR